MRIALIAHDSRKELLAQFCTAYMRILSQNELVATGVTGKVVHDTCGLPVRCLYPGARGGAEQISSMIACGEIDMLLFFRDPGGAEPGGPGGRARRRRGGHNSLKKEIPSCRRESAHAACVLTAGDG